MVVFKKRDVESALKKKGFEKKKTHHKFYRLFIDDKDAGIFTKVSHGRGDISDFLVNCMAKQVGISKNEFVDVINCPIGKEELIIILRDKYNKNI